MNVTINRVEMPKPGRKYGKLILADDSIIMCRTGLIEQFQAGMTAEIGTKTEVWAKGTDRETTTTVALTGPLKQEEQKQP